MNAAALSHRPVLFDEVLAAMQVKPDGVYVDATFGRGGHASAMLEMLGSNGRLIVMDRDPQAIAWAQQTLSKDSRVRIIHDEYAKLKNHIEMIGLSQLVDGVLLDLGVSSPQLDDAGRGFSFQQNGPLDMRMDTTQGISAQQWLMHASEKEMSEVLWQLGEERFARRIARKIVDFRQQQPIKDTATLVSIISDCVPSGKEKKHPATRSFQAIRMKINQELEQVQQVLNDIFDVLKIGGRVLVISFHSLEDRLVKRFFKQHSSMAPLPRGLPLREQDISSSIRLKTIGKAIKAGLNEVENNPRSRSAILRIAERVS